MLFSRHNRKPWAFIGNSKKVFISLEKAIKCSHKDKWILADTRTKIEFRESHIPGSIHVNFAFVKKFILSMNPKKHLILIARDERTFIAVVAWAKAKGYNHIYLLQKGITPYINSDKLTKF